MSVDAITYRNVVGNFATGVAVVTAGSRESCFAVTVNSFTSVSLDPTLLLVCLTTASRTRAEIMRSRVFNINVLSEGQEEISRLFARSQDDSSWFDELGCTAGQLGGPLIPGCLAHIECQLDQTHDAGDHTILIAEVHNAYIALEDNPLLFFRGKYGQIDQTAVG
jgi:flavin reductase (DIM6/NTAB) family NADH-FMN oxidoreductase RutF